MDTCRNECNLDYVAELIGRHYNEKGYSFDVFDKENNLIDIQDYLVEIIEVKTCFDDFSTSDTCCATGYVKIPFALQSLNKGK